MSYTIVLGAEAITAISRYEITNRSSFWFILIGVGLFAVSDTLLAFLKFNAIKTDFGRFAIMLTYYGSQYFIMHGALHQSNLQYEIDAYEASQKRVYWLVFSHHLNLLFRLGFCNADLILNMLILEERGLILIQQIFVFIFIIMVIGTIFKQIGHLVT